MVFIDAIHVQIRDSQVANRPIYVALAVATEGNRDILGLWATDGGEGAKYWLQVLAEIKNRGTEDVLMVVCDGLQGLPDSVAAVWPETVVQTCVVHLMRNSFKYASKADWPAISAGLKLVYHAATLPEAEDRFADLKKEWEERYPAVIRMWQRVWSEEWPCPQGRAPGRICLKALGPVAGSKHCSS